MLLKVNCFDIDELVINGMSRGVAKGGPGRAQAQPKVGCALPIKIEKDRYTLI